MAYNLATVSTAKFVLALVLVLSTRRCADAPPERPDEGRSKADANDSPDADTSPASSACRDRGGDYVGTEGTFEPPADAQPITRELVLTCSEVRGTTAGTIIRSQAELDALLARSRCEGPAPAVDFSTRAVAVIASSQPFATVSWAVAHEHDALEVGVSASAYCEGAAPPPPPTVLLAIPPEIRCVSVTFHVFGSCDSMHPKA